MAEPRSRTHAKRTAPRSADAEPTEEQEPKDGEEPTPETPENDGASDQGAPDGDGGAAGEGDGASEEEGGMDDPRYPVSDLCEGARTYFDCSPHAVAGALSGDPGKLWTVAEARQAVKAFLEQEYSS